MDKVSIYSLNISDTAKKQLEFAGVKDVDTLCGLSFDQLYLLGVSKDYFAELMAVMSDAYSSSIDHAKVDDAAFEKMLSNFQFKARMSGIDIPTLPDNDNDNSAGYIDEFEADDKMKELLSNPVNSDGLAELLKMADEKIDDDSKDGDKTSGISKISSLDPGELGDLLGPGMFTTAVEVRLDPTDIDGSVDNLDAPDSVKSFLKGLLGNMDISALSKEGSAGIAGVIRGRRITSDNCIVCGNRLKYSNKYGALYCSECDAWRSEKCSDPNCWACNNRPDKPSDDKEL